MRTTLAQLLDETRGHTLRLAAGVPDAAWRTQPAPQVSPPAWELGHVAWFEDQWLVARLGGAPASPPEAAALYDADRAPRPERGALELPDRGAVLRLQAEVRTEALRVLAGVELDTKDPLVRDGFVHRMVADHEAQHAENLLHGLALLPGYEPPRLAAPPLAAVEVHGMARVPGGPFPLGAPLGPGVYDNEAPLHAVDVPQFWIDRAPVTNDDFARFVAAGGYREPAHWDEDGWLLREALGWEHPAGWRPLQRGWAETHFGRVAPLEPRAPVQHVSWYEADAYARWAGKRLPTEAEWEKAATWDPAVRAKREGPWGGAPWRGRANLDARCFAPAPVGAFPEGASPVGCHQMLGDVWEWTASELRPYPGFAAFPYEDYSVPWMRGGWFVLRGGSWATRPGIARATFRNWAQPEHRHLFAGFRCAADAPPREPP